jgi:glutamate racemase
MIGVFGSGIGGLTVLRALAARCSKRAFVYLGDHAHAPYGDRPSDEIVELLRLGVTALFERGARLVILGCNTATAIALRKLQQEWLPRSGLRGHNVIGIVAPTVEAATQTPWAVTKPQ